MKLHEEISVRWIVLYICVLASISGGSNDIQPPSSMNSISETSIADTRSSTNFDDSVRSGFEPAQPVSDASQPRK
ncbi:MAG TPA: hypothetical protein VFP87_13825 [Chitinophagaceae bacterium]|nr:hypothetical protein [Chitinophagaceae bacterium]